MLNPVSDQKSSVEKRFGVHLRTLRTDMGIPDGLPPEVSARWGVDLALRCDPDLNGAVFERDTEVLPPLGLKSRINQALTGQRRRPRRLEPQA